MSDYIKREDTIQEVKAWSMFGKDDLVSRLERLPSADAMPIRHGRWIEHHHSKFGPLLNDMIECSECHSYFTREHLIRNSYCPNCGARMDGGDNE